MRARSYRRTCFRRMDRRARRWVRRSPGGCSGARRAGETPRAGIPRGSRCGRAVRASLSHALFPPKTWRLKDGWPEGRAAPSTRREVPWTSPLPLRCPRSSRVHAYLILNAPKAAEGRGRGYRETCPRRSIAPTPFHQGEGEREGEETAIPGTTYVHSPLSDEGHVAASSRSEHPRCRSSRNTRREVVVPPRRAI